MNDLISRSELKKALEEKCCGDCRMCDDYCVFENGVHHCRLIDDAPAVDAKKEFEPKLANWRLVPNTNGERYCTNCHTIVDFYSQKNYCLYCGAKMIAYETPNGLILRTDETYYTYGTN